METKCYQLKNDRGEVICNQLMIASSLFDRMKGLMFVNDMPNCDGLLLSPCNSIHTFFMLFEIDVYFLDKNFKVLKIIKAMKPWRISSIYFKSKYVLEIKSNTLKYEIRENDKLEAVCIN